MEGEEPRQPSAANDSVRENHAMRSKKLTAVALLIPTLLASTMPAQANGKRIVEPSCEVIAPNCAAPQPACVRPEPSCESPPKKPCPPPCETPPPQQSVVPQPLGAFVQPPATGEVRGPVYSTELQGASITFPELRLRMPSIRMPSVAKYRADSRMETAPAHAPYMAAPVGAPVAAAPYAAPMAAAPVMAAPYAAPYMAAPVMTAPVMTGPYAPPAAPYAAPPQPPAAITLPAAPYRSPDCAATSNSAQAAFDPLDEKLRRIEAAERRLQAQVDELHRCLKQLPANQPGAANSSTHSRIPLRPIGPIGNSASEDAVVPTSPPQPPPDLGRQPRLVPAPSATQYPAQPAAHYQVAPMPNHVIREPGQPRAFITGLR